MARLGQLLIRRAARRCIDATAIDSTESVTQPMDVRLPSRYLALSIGLLLASCRATTLQATGNAAVDLRNSDPRVRIDAALRTVDEGRRDLAYLLVENLSDRDEAVRFYTAIALRKVTGLDFGFKSYGDLVERTKAIERWHEWLESNGQSSENIDGAPLTPPDVVPEDNGEGVTESGPVNHVRASAASYAPGPPDEIFRSVAFKRTWSLLTEPYRSVRPVRATASMTPTAENPESA